MTSPSPTEPSTAGMWAEAEGIAALDYYDRSGDPADLRTADDALTRALGERPGHPDRIDWAIRLSDAWTDRVDDGTVEDYDRALAWTRLLVDELDPADTDRVVAVVRLADLAWDRSWMLRYGDDTPPDAAADLGRLVTLLTDLTVGDANLTVSRYLRMLRGMALAEQTEIGVGEVGRAVATLGPALDELTRTPVADDGTEVADWVGDNRLALGAYILAEALNRVDDLDRATAVLDRAISGHTDAGPIRTTLSTRLAALIQQRWHEHARAGDETAAAADLEAGIAACLRAGDTDDPWLLGVHGELLTARAETNDSDDDARSAAGLLERAAELAAGDPDSWLLWQSAAAANRLRTGDPAALTVAFGQLTRSGTYDLPDDDRLALFVDQIAIGDDLLRHGRVDPLRQALAGGAAALDAAPGADPGLRAGLALILVYGSFAATGTDLGDVDVAGIHRLLDLAATHSAADKEWQAMVDSAAGVLEHYEDMLSPDGTGDFGMRRLARAAAFRSHTADFADRLRLVLAIAGQASASSTGDRRAGEAARRHGVAGRPDSRPPGPTGGPPISASDLAAVEIYSRLMERMQAGDMAGGAVLAREALPVLEKAEPSELGVVLSTLLRAVVAAADPAGSAPIEIPEIEPGRGMDHLVRTAGALVTAAVALAQAATRNDVARIRQIVESLERLAAVAPPDRVRIGCAGLAGMGYLELVRRSPRDTRDARHAAARFAEAMTGAGGVGFPLWSQFAMGRAEALRLAGDPDLRGTRDLGMSALQGHAWQVFAQAGTDNSIAAARQAATDARKVADWCQADRRRDPDALEQMVAALDAGRGLVLRATTTSRVVAERLTRAGHPELAVEWRETAGQGRDMVTGLAMGGPLEGTEIPDDLRLRVLRALGDDQVLGYEPIVTREIRAALRATGTHALVYLVGAEDGRDGAAVVVPSGGPPLVIALPRLELGPDSPVRWYVRTQPRAARSRVVATGPDTGPADRDVGPVAEVADPGRGLDRLCAWAWDAAMGDLLRVVGGRPGRRLVLIPMGMLALVPWHAAFNRTRDRRHYAAEEAVISYSPSARAFCASAARPLGPVTSALVIGDPTGDLPYAGIEARAVHRRFYPDGDYLGADGTPDAVQQWITSGVAGGAVLHFACHGAVDPRRPADAHLVLAGHAGLTARMLLDGSRGAELDIREVFLAACTTTVTGHDHDEVLSLATSFLAAGARTVFGSLWPVPDGDTSLLMFKVHEFLRTWNLPPADALHRAQLWMLDPERDTTGLPPDLLVGYQPRREFGLTSWAGFIHIGR